MSGTGIASAAQRRPPPAEGRDAATVWRRMLSGQLVVRRHHEENGRRYLYLEEPDVDALARPPLTERERVVIAYRACGQGLKRIASELGLSVPTVTRCLSRGLHKLGLKSDIELPAVFGAASRPR